MMSFWKTFGFQTVSAIDTILDGGDYTLEQLLDEEEILQETKSQNKKLIDFLIEPDSLRTLLSYITDEPDEDADQKRKFKYPFLACEILASEVWAICDAFYQHQEFLDKLYSFLEKDPPLNPMLASYTSRVAGVLLQKKVSETISYMKEKKNMIDCFIKHLGNANVMDLLLKVIACEDIPDGEGTLQWLCETDLIKSLINKFDPNLSEEINENASQALVDIIVVSMNSTDSPLIAQLESEEMVKTLFTYILSGGLNSSLLHGLTVVIELLHRHWNDEVNTTTSTEELPALLRIIVENLEAFNTLLLDPTKDSDGKEKKVFLAAVGEITPLGFHRLKIIEFFAALVPCNYKYVDDALIKLDIFSTCLDLFFRYPWNNFLHSAVAQMIQGVIRGRNSELKTSLLKDSKFLDKVCEASEENDTANTRPVGVRRGYMGHIILLSLSLIEQSHEEPSLKQILDGHEKWKQYEKGALNAAREKETMGVGYIPEYADDDYEFDEEIAPQSSSDEEDYTAQEVIESETSLESNVPEDFQNQLEEGMREEEVNDEMKEDEQVQDEMKEEVKKETKEEMKEEETKEEMKEEETKEEMKEEETKEEMKEEVAEKDVAVEPKTEDVSQKGNDVVEEKEKEKDQTVEEKQNDQTVEQDTDSGKQVSPSEQNTEKTEEKHEPSAEESPKEETKANHVKTEPVEVTN